MNKRIETCAGCNKTFSDISSLRRHVKKKHDNDAKLTKYKYKVAEQYAYTCHCGRNFSRKKSYNYHLKISHSLNKDKVSQVKRLQKCPLCDFSCLFQKDLLEHFRNIHSISVKYEELKFDNFEEFGKWKNVVENKTGSRYVILRSTSKSSVKCIKYSCNRSGDYIPSVKNRTRRLKIQGTNKINGICPAGIILWIDKSGQCRCKFANTHIGHNQDLGHVFLSPLERKICAEKIAAKVPFDVILDQVRDSASDSDLQRLRLLTRRDLHNIKKSYNLFSDTTRHENDSNVWALADEAMEAGMEAQDESQEGSANLTGLSDEVKIEPEYLVPQINTESKSNEESAISSEVENLKQEFMDLLKNIKTMSQLEVIKKCIAHIKPKLQELDCSSRSTCTPPRSVKADKKKCDFIKQEK